MIIAFTGNRPDKLGGFNEPNPIRDQIKTTLDKLLRGLAAEHSDLRCISGMALGFDQWAAEICIELKIPFTAAVPFRGQELHWPESSQRIYRDLMKRAAWVEIICVGDYAPWKMQRRSEWMVDNCDLVVACWDGSAGGTANCVAYAKKVGRPVKNIMCGREVRR